MGFFCSSVPRSFSDSLSICTNIWAFSGRGRNYGCKNFKLTCRAIKGDFANSDWLSSASPYDVLGVARNCNFSDIKAAFRSRVKEFHPDVSKDTSTSDVVIRRVIEAYEVLSKRYQPETTERDCSDAFEEPECEAFDLFINGMSCMGRRCPYPCVKRAPHIFSFDAVTGIARVSSAGQGEDDKVQLAVGQCPRSCIYYVTPSQRVILDELLENIMNCPYDDAEIALLESLIVKAKFQNNRYRSPSQKRSPKASTQYSDWF